MFAKAAARPAAASIDEMPDLPWGGSPSPWEERWEEEDVLHEHAALEETCTQDALAKADAEFGPLLDLPPELLEALYGEDVASVQETKAAWAAKEYESCVNPMDVCMSLAVNGTLDTFEGVSQKGSHFEADDPDLLKEALDYAATVYGACLDPATFCAEKAQKTLEANQNGVDPDTSSAQASALELYEKCMEYLD